MIAYGVLGHPGVVLILNVLEYIAEPDKKNVQVSIKEKIAV